MQRGELSMKDRILKSNFESQVKAATAIFGKQLVNTNQGIQGKIYAGIFNAMRGKSSADEQDETQRYMYDIFFRNCHAFCDQLALQIYPFKLTLKLFFLRKASARNLLFSAIALNVRPPRLQDVLRNNQQMMNLQNTQQMTMLQNM
ncbi:hypothetical protein MMC12_005236 [Toensbergia leucococca]|nr:hypothetical protein [Toensbergia leucococca]